MNFLRISVVTSIIVSSMMSAAFAATGEYTPNIWDHRTLQKVETRLDQFAKNGEKEMLIYIVGRTSVGLDQLKDAKSQYILSTMHLLAKKYFEQAVVVVASGSQTIAPNQTESTTDLATTGTTSNTPVSSGSVATSGGLETGIASYYASSLQGNNTANGDIFDNEKFTAAHKTLPFNTRVKVTNTKADKRVIVRINDRGPYAKGRIIDLSQAAFKTLAGGSLSAGLLDVQLEILP